jgi:anti-sigma regulatory factor (Ser/Thr protein kinase)
MSDNPDDGFQFTAPATAAGLANCRQIMEGSVLYTKLPARLQFAADLALDELATNTIKYGGADGASFEFNLRYAANSLFITYKDHGAAFDPWRKAEEALRSLDSSDDPEIGGRGLIMMKELSVTRAYERCDGANVVTLRVLENAEVDS